MSTSSPAHSHDETLDLIREAASRFLAHYKGAPATDAEQATVNMIVHQVYDMMMRETSGQGMPGNGRTKLALMILTLVLGAGVPTYAGTAQGDWVYAAVGAGGLILGVVLSLLLPWKGKQ